jgi:rhodanese-related sulfurtransferase/cytochrome c553
MAAFGSELGGPLEPDQIRAIIEWLRRKQSREPVALDAGPIPGDAERGSELYRSECARCHGERGEGTSAVSLSNPRFLASASDAFLQHAIREGREGTEMVAYGGHLPPEEIAALTAYIRTWERPVQPATALARAPKPTAPLLHPDGPRPDFVLRKGRYLAADDLKAALDRKARVVLVDARPMSDWIASHLPGALPIPYYDVNALAEKLPKDGTMIVAYCACPHAASGKVVDHLRTLGFPATAILDEGFRVWVERGYPVVSGDP